MKFSAYILPVFLILLVGYAAFKKINPYDCFAEGAKGALPLIARLFPYLCAVFMLTELFELSGAAKFLSRALTPILKVFGIPPELSKLMLIKPMSGSGSLALLSEIYSSYGADSYISRCASVVYSSSETVFYLAAIYYAKSGGKKILAPVLIALISGFIAAVFGCFLCLIL